MKKRTKGILVRFTEDEKNIVKTKAASAGFNTEAYCRDAILHGTVAPLPPVDFRAFTTEIRRIGNNLNQVVALAHTKGFIDVVRLNSLMDELWNLERQAGDLFRRAG